jgi:hypothetical protein
MIKLTEKKEIVKAMIAFVTYFGKITVFKKQLPKLIKLDDFRDEIVHSCKIY